MSKDLIARILKQREVRIPVGKFTFIARRPDDIEMASAFALKQDEQIRRFMGFVVGWEGVTEDDVAGGAVQDPVPFDAALWLTWAGDRLEFWNPITDALIAAYNEHLKGKEVAQKK